MKIVKIEPTPSPNVMKLTMNESLNPGVRLNYTKETQHQAPIYVRELLQIERVIGVYQTGDFIALERHPKGNWQAILQQAQYILQVDETKKATDKGKPIDTSNGFGEVVVRVQTFRGIPMQVRVSSGLEEKREALSQRFVHAATEAGLHSPNLIMERKLIEFGIRYGELEEVLHEILAELEAVYDEQRVQQLVEAAKGISTDEDDESIQDDRALSASDWQTRFAFLERLKPSEEVAPFYIRALDDPHLSIRRFALAQMGSLTELDVMPYIIKALGDPSPMIRRTAGDVCSDRGDASALPAMTALLRDPNKLVRWRAARFIYEMGGEAELEALKGALNDSEFEIRLQIELAIERIEHGGAAEGTVWQQMMRRSQ